MNEVGVETLNRNYKKAGLDNKKRQDVQAKIEKLQTKRFEAFRLLAERNIGVAARAEKLIELGKKLSGRSGSTTKSPWVVLREFDHDLTGVIGFVTKDTSIAADRSNIRQYFFRFYATDAEGVAAIKDHPVMPYRNVMDRGQIVNDPTLPIRRAGSEDQVPVKVDLDYSQFNVLGAIRRSRAYDQMRDSVVAVENSVGLFESAITNPDLNPRLASIALTSETSPQE